MPPRDRASKAVQGGSPPEALRRELARGTAELAILAVLGGGRRYGYELLSLLNGLTGGAPEIKEGTLYPILHRLEDAGQITSTWEAHDRTPPRKYYLLTATGQDQLVALRAEWERLVAGMRRLLDASEGVEQ
ncbi:MAG: PadR family transcriptional regulator [Candidatus Dormibacteraeota bacterium]|nr:PadR family transcriptional regulator [Candidatus Dormibacteraeota bacterium]